MSYNNIIVTTEMAELAEIPKGSITDGVDVRGGMLKLEKLWKKQEGHTLGNDWVDKYGGEMDHHFMSGMYIRRASAPKGMIFTTQIHKVRHPFFILKGKAKILTDNGVEILEAPYFGITEPGTKRLMEIVEDIEWYTVHATEETTVEGVERDVLAKDFKELEEKPQHDAHVQDYLKHIQGK